MFRHTMSSWLTPLKKAVDWKSVELSDFAFLNMPLISTTQILQFSTWHMVKIEMIYNIVDQGMR